MPNLKEMLREVIAKKHLEKLPRAFDIVGDIAIVDIPRGLGKYQKKIAAAVMNVQPHVKAVHKRIGGREGKLRLQKLSWLKGEKRTETVCVENGVRLKLDVAAVYYSVRMAHERLRIVSQVRKGEDVLVMFSGAGPYVVEIAKLTGARSVVGIEVNKKGHRYALENIQLNKVSGKATAYCGDVRSVVPKLKKRFSRILMPLPKGASGFLPLALAFVKKGGMIHFYDFERDEDLPAASIAKVKKAAAGKKISVKRVVKCGQLAPRAYRVCVDFTVKP
jgi:tRNA (guanine37-N1)-methyltransferase